MAKSIHRKKRSKLTVVLFAPILIIVFIIGWSFYWIGQSKRPNTKQSQKTVNKTPAKQDDVELIVIPPLEKEILAN